MKRVLIAGVVALLCACGTSGNNSDGGGGAGGNGGGGDMSASAGDLAMTVPPDMLPAYGCHALTACVATCMDQTCIQNCGAAATSQAKTLYNAVRSCVRRVCNPHPDAGPAPCSGGGTPSAQCTQCRNDVLKMTGTCGADTMWCGQCYAEYSACQNNTP